jgi:uncharacterized membrane protein
MAPAIEHVERFRARPEAVYDLIAQVEAYPRYCSAIREVRATGADAFRWTVSLAGLPLQWDALVTDRTRPARFAWRSTRGVENDGEFRLARRDGETEVRFTMHYRLPALLPESVARLITVPLARHITAELLEALRRRLEPGATA